jgi:hypothetical protein
MTPIKAYLTNGTLPESSLEADRLVLQSQQYKMEDGLLYKKSYLAPLLRCITPNEGAYISREIHMGICGTHARPHTIITSIMHLGYYWPTMYADVEKEILKCEAWQIHAPVQRSPKNNLILLTSPWPFYKWGIDIVRPFTEAPVWKKFFACCYGLLY